MSGPWEKYQSTDSAGGPWEKYQAAPPEESWGHYLGRHALEALPVAGNIAGDIAGAASPIPGGFLAGGALGYAGGKQLENLGKKYLMGEDVPENTVGGIAGDLASGGALSTGGALVGKALSPVAKYISGKLASGAEAATVAHLNPGPQLSAVLGKDALRGAARATLDSGAMEAGTKVGTTVGNLERMAAPQSSLKQFIEQGGQEAANPNPNLGLAGELAKVAANKAPGGLSNAFDWGAGANAIKDIMHGNVAGPMIYAGKKMAEGRVASTAAVGLDAASKAAKSLFGDGAAFTANQMSKIASSPYLQQLQSAHQNGGPSAVNTTSYILQQTDPKFQELVKDDGK